MAELFYDGPSEIDGAPIRGYVSHNSSNRKTGDMLQTWIIRSDMSPLQACKSGADKSICGNCPHRPSSAGTCYVLVHQAPTAISKSQDRPLPKASHHKGLRLGAYGDPTAIPYGHWRTLMAQKDSTSHTGYTHQWRTCDQRFQSLCMASVDNEDEQREASKLGWRTYRVMPTGAALLAGEILCPSSRGVKCTDCRLCAGTANTGRNIAIEIHGSKGKINLFEKNYAK
jgi:hypothetical protein